MRGVIATSVSKVEAVRSFGESAMEGIIDSGM
jgi:hypothetical protein